jgi:hypothetical protein
MELENIYPYWIHQQVGRTKFNLNNQTLFFPNENNFDSFFIIIVKYSPVNIFLIPLFSRDKIGVGTFLEVNVPSPN